ncbi:hypothetical protein SAMN05421833_1269 [Microbispora rosea]|uniref:PknH-like extracellular domain-containing protein n=1 Tax=Microbispora rosea TaxID=58117 RepID=A0A1N7G4C2_9ACTN|nr:hypothetical protein [Microbispora rosea]GIH46166.1 hypothetical protein Mro03_13450 [Microbispora rosea subsp. rosea]SIS07450.1 hypothetical protein SAMN05421833_1269 [Microbispora rosea]
MKLTRCAVVVSAALCLLAVAACGGKPRAGMPVTPMPGSPVPADAVIVDKDQVLTCGEGEGQGSAQALCDAIAGVASPEPVSRASARPSPAPSVEQVFEAEVLKKGRPLSPANPGSGPGDPRLRRALLVDYRGVHESITKPGAVVALPAAEGRATEFISARQAAGVFERFSGCDWWTVGSWRVALRDFNRPGVQIAATLLSAMSDEAWKRSAEFSETIVTGPAPMLNALGDPAAMASCRGFLNVWGHSMHVEPIPVPPLGTRSWAFRVMEGKSVTQWVEVVRTPRYVLEVRIPNQWPRPRTDPAVLLPRIAAAAYARAEAALT